MVNKLMKMADDLAESYIHTGPELLADAIRMVGGQGALARATGYSQHGIWWALNHRHISAPFAAMVELATGGQIRREDVCTEPWVFAGLLRPKDHGAVQQALQMATRKPESE